MSVRPVTHTSLRMRDGRHHVQIVHGRHGCCAQEPGGTGVLAIGVDEDEALANLGDALALLNAATAGPQP